MTADTESPDDIPFILRDIRRGQRLTHGTLLSAGVPLRPRGGQRTRTE
ncbi:hypothetical protein [Streptomyces sp. NPDC003032]